MSYVIAGWLITFGALGAYSVAVLRKGRNLARRKQGK